MKYLLLSECLQNDFVAPLAQGARLPNDLHIGRAESRRLLGDPDGDWATSGPLARFLAAWQPAASDARAAIHIRDWHDPAREETRGHLEFFGPHCLQGTDGARFVAPLERLIESVGPAAHIIDSAEISDFVDTDLQATLDRIASDASDVRVGLIGVWTDFKVRYLAYDLLTRTRLRQIAVCSALTASRSRIHHRQALDHLAASLGVIVIDSLAEFMAWMGLAKETPTISLTRRAAPRIEMPAEVAFADEERRLVEYLFRDCSIVKLHPLGGGFSGSRVFRTESLDRRGFREIPFVVKLDSHAKIAQERVAVESVENMLGAASPRMADYVDLETLGAIKYQFATMHGGTVRTLKNLVADGPDAASVARLFDALIERVLLRLYQGPTLDRVQLFSYYSYRPEYAAGTLEHVSRLAERESETQLWLTGVSAGMPHPRLFYERLDARLAEEPVDVPCTHIHGDLNLANVLMDESGNTWLIDYFWTRIGHALKDIAKIENDLKFLMLKIGAPRDLGLLLRYERFLLQAADLAQPLAHLPEDLASYSNLVAIHAAIVRLRALAADLLAGAGAASPVDPRQYHIAQLRYSAHTLSFDECDALQRQYALLSTCLLAESLGTPTEAIEE